MNNIMFPGVSPQTLIQAMKGELEARKYYEKLIPMAPNEKESDIIRHFCQDEIKHFTKFRMLYVMMTGTDPVIPPINLPVFTGYLEGVEQAILDELEAYEFYRDIYLSSANPIVRNIFFEALTDENEHAAHLNYIFIKNK